MGLSLGTEGVSASCVTYCKEGIQKRSMSLELSLGALISSLCQHVRTKFSQIKRQRVLHEMTMIWYEMTITVTVKSCKYQGLDGEFGFQNDGIPPLQEQIKSLANVDL